MTFRILIVEDDKVQSFILCNILTKRGYKVTKAFNGLEAIDRLRHEKINLVISDIDMEKMNGLELKEEMNKFLNWRLIPFIFLTNRNNTSTKEKAFELGVNLYLEKSFFIDIAKEIEKLIKKPDNFYY